MFNNSLNSVNLSYLDRLKKINYIIIFLIFILFGFGLLSLLSVAEGNFNLWPLRHFYRFLIGLLILFCLSIIDIKYVFKFAYIVFFLKRNCFSFNSIYWNRVIWRNKMD